MTLRAGAFDSSNFVDATHSPSLLEFSDDASGEVNKSLIGNNEGVVPRGAAEGAGIGRCGHDTSGGAVLVRMREGATKLNVGGGFKTLEKCGCSGANLGVEKARWERKGDNSVGNIRIGRDVWARD
jgi:hypothetical protein